MAPFALALLAGGLALFWAAAGAIAAWVATSSGSLGRIVALALALTCSEWLRGWVFTGFPWGMVATIWANTTLVMHASWAGPHGLGLLTLSVAALLAATAFARTRTRLALAAAAAALLGGLHAGGQRLSATIPAQPAADAPVIRLVQPNAPQHLKWRDDMIPVFWSRKIDLTGARPKADLVVWPEVSLPYLLGTRSGADGEVARAAGGAPVLVGAQRYAGADLRNSAAVIAPDGAVTQVYDKHHLVPFGEYFPGGALADRLGLAGLATDALGGFSPGPGPRLLDLRAFGLGHVLPLICYEAIFPRYAMPPAEVRPDWIVQLTNDAWFGRHAGPQQHLAQARFRAVEQGLPLVRVANTGISAVIDAAGRLRGTLPLDATGARDVALPPAMPPTPYARFGDGPLFGLMAGLAALLLWARARS